MTDIYYHQPSDTHIVADRDFRLPIKVEDEKGKLVDDYLQCGADWFGKATPEQLAEHGLQLVKTVGTPQEKTHFVTYETVGAERRVVNTPKPASMLAEAAQIETNVAAQRYLDDTDWKMRRHNDELLAQKAPSLTAAELSELLTKRDEARQSIVRAVVV